VQSTTPPDRPIAPLNPPSGPVVLEDPSPSERTASCRRVAVFVSLFPLSLSLLLAVQSCFCGPLPSRSRGASLVFPQLHTIVGPSEAPVPGYLPTYSGRTLSLRLVDRPRSFLIPRYPSVARFDLALSGPLIFHSFSTTNASQPVRPLLTCMQPDQQQLQLASICRTPPGHNCSCEIWSVAVFSDLRRYVCSVFFFLSSYQQVRPCLSTCNATPNPSIWAIQAGVGTPPHLSERVEVFVSVATLRALPSSPHLHSCQHGWKRR
jgi:hypothetical protein